MAELNIAQCHECGKEFYTHWLSKSKNGHDYCANCLENLGYLARDARKIPHGGPPERPPISRKAIQESVLRARDTMESMRKEGELRDRPKGSRTDTRRCSNCGEHVFGSDTCFNCGAYIGPDGREIVIGQH
jgi:hypothetical protein